MREVVAQRVRRAAAKLRVDAPRDHRRDQVTGLRRVELVAAHDAEKADKGAHPRMLEMAEDKFLGRGVEIFQILAPFGRIFSSSGRFSSIGSGTA